MLNRVTRRLGRSGSLFALLLLLAFSLPSHAQAQSLEALRASGAVGESFTGYAVARQSSASAFVEGVNQKRRQIYEKRASEQGVEASAVGKLYAQQIFREVAPGTWLQQPDGSWTRR